MVYFDADTAEEWGKEEGQDVIMVRPFTRPDDVHGMLAAKGILTSEGGATSHAAVVARQFGVPCVVGACDVSLNLEKRKLTVGDITVKKATGSPWTAPPAKSFWARSPRSSPNFEEQNDLHHPAELGRRVPPPGSVGQRRLPG